jgi:hypothetical protein
LTCLLNLEILKVRRESTLLRQGESRILQKWGVRFFV